MTHSRDPFLSKPVPQKDRTTRQMIIEAINGKMLTSKEISGAVGIREKEVFEHLDHIARSFHKGGPGGRVFVVEPSECLDCGFVFRKRERLRTPSRCPVCKSEGITETRFGLIES